MYHHATSTSLSPLRFFVVWAVLLVGTAKEGYGQRVYADVQSSGTTGSASASVSNPTSSINQDNLLDFSSLSANTTLVLTSTAWQQLIFSTNLPANSIVYIKFTSNNGLLGNGIGVQAYANSTSNSNGNTVTTQWSTFTSIDGMTYVAVTSESSFNAVRLTLSSPALIGTATANIYYAFVEATHTDCADAIGTSIGGSGISLGGNVFSRLNAVDNNLTTFSTISGGVIGLGNTISQTAHFASRSNIGDAATITFSVPASPLLQLSLFNDVTINTYNGFDVTPVSSTSLSSLLSLDLLGLLSSGDEYTVSVVPNEQFDRIEVSVATGISLLNNFRIHEIQRTPAAPTTPSSHVEICEGDDAIIAIGSSSPGSVLRWYSEDGVSLENIESTGNPNEYIYLYTGVGEYKVFVTAAWGVDCLAESERTQVAIIVHTKPPTPEISLR